MFLGQFEHTIDEKGRITIPSEYREELGSSVYLTQGFDGNIQAYPSEMFKQLLDLVKNTNFLDGNSRRLRRLLFANAKRLDFDSAGRILIPSFLRKQAGLNNVAIIAGSGAYFELWSPEQWHKQEEALNDIEANEQRFSALDLSKLP